MNTWAISLLPAPSVVPGVAPAQSGVWPKLFWKHWLREARTTSEGVRGIIWLADLCSTSWTIWRLRSWICFCISHSTCMANCWVKPGRGVSSTLRVSCPADVEATAPPGSGLAVTEILPEWFGPPGCQYWCHLCYHCIPENISSEGSGWESIPAPPRIPHMAGTH